MLRRGLVVTRWRASRPIADRSRLVVGAAEESTMSSEFERLFRVWRLAEMRRDLIAMVVIQSRVGRLTMALLEGAALRG